MYNFYKNCIDLQTPIEFEPSIMNKEKLQANEEGIVRVK